MTKRWPLLLIFIFLVVGLFYLLRKKEAPSPISQTSKASKGPEAPVIDPKKLEIDGKKVVGLSPGKEEAEIKSIRVANAVSNEWENNLEESIRLQGGSQLKDIEIQKVDSFVWAQDGVALFVESVIVTVKNLKNEETTFRVLVDAQNGKILKNWDRPVIDPVNPRENFGIKVDPRYHND